MRGRFGELGELWFEMELLASGKLTIPIDVGSTPDLQVGLR